MKTTNFTRHPWNEIVFENRNKLYGAYDLRETYDVRVRRALFLTFSFITIVIATPLIISHYFSKLEPLIIDKGIIFSPTPLVEQVQKITPQEIKKPQNNAPKKANLPFLAVNDTLPTPQHIDTAEIIPPTNGPVASASTGNNGTNDDPAPPSSNGTFNAAPVVHEAWQVDKMPEFPGGIKAFYKYMEKNIHYPSSSYDKEGVVNVSFVINGEGTVTGVKLLHGMGYGFDDEAMQVISKMPKWKPGFYHGESVSTSMQLPVRFVLSR